MHTRIILTPVILFSLILTSCATSNLTKEQMISIAKDLEAAINDGDIEAVMALVTDDVVIASTSWGRIEGKEEAREWFENEIEKGAKVYFLDFHKEVQNLRHDVRGSYADGTSIYGTERIKFDGVKIKYLGP